MTTKQAPAAGDDAPANQGGPAAASNDPATSAELPNFEPTGFNLSQFKLDQNFAEHGGGQKLLTTIPVRKPSKESWFRTHPKEEYRLPAYVIELKQQGEIFLVARALCADLGEESTFVSKLLIPTLTRQGDLLLWPIRLPGADGSSDPWSTSALEAANTARTKWVRMSSKRSLGAYELIVAPDPQPEPNWPIKSLNEIVQIAFKGHVIDTLDHPVIRQLRGVA